MIVQIDTDTPKSYERGNQILETQGADAARQYFTDLVRKNGGTHALFGTAWTEFLDGHYDKAVQTCRYLLSESKSVHIRAHCQYLLGHIATSRGQYAEAFRHLGSAHGAYESLKDCRNLYKTRLGLAHVSIMSKDQEGADQFLNQALETNRKAGLPLDYYYILRKKLAAQRKEYDKAFQFSKEALAIYREAGNRLGEAVALDNMALYAIVTGRSKEALTYLTEASKILESHKNTSAEKYYHYLCRILYNRCQGLPYQALYNTVSNWIDNQQNKFLLYDLKFVMNYPCQKAGNSGRKEK
ncbi:MAG: tetratricopeptide repeat protein [Acidobacteriota bacterium]|nr:tetratricopeptide repeat protein [Acidobacteriota bacterium]